LTYVSYREARRRVETAFSKLHLTTEKVPLDSALGRISSENVVSGRNIPSAHVSAMDGYALRSKDTSRGSAAAPTRLKVVGKANPDRSGLPAAVKGRETCYIQTGDPLPQGVDAVVRVEQAVLDGFELLVKKPLKQWKNVMKRGEDVHLGQMIVKKGGRLGPAALALMLALGRKDVEVYRLPRVGILSVGSELTTGDGSDEGKKVNNYAHLLAGFLRELGAEPVLVGVSGDSTDVIAGSISSNIEGLDMLLTTGRSSVGLGDSVAGAVASLPDSELIFHGIKMLPVRPTGVARVGRIPVCILPGHAVSATFSFFLVCVPILNLMTGIRSDARPHTIMSMSAQPITNSRPFTSVYLVRLTSSKKGFLATTMPWGSNSLASLSAAEGFVMLPPGASIRKGGEIGVTLLGDSELTSTLQV